MVTKKLLAMSLLGMKEITTIVNMGNQKIMYEGIDTQGNEVHGSVGVHRLAFLAKNAIMTNYGIIVKSYPMFNGQKKYWEAEACKTNLSAMQFKDNEKHYAVSNDSEQSVVFHMCDAIITDFKELI